MKHVVYLMVFLVTPLSPPQRLHLGGISGELPTYPSHNATLTFASRLGQNVGLGKGKVGSFPRT